MLTTVRCCRCWPHGSSHYILTGELVTYYENARGKEYYIVRDMLGREHAGELWTPNLHPPSPFAAIAKFYEAQQRLVARSKKNGHVML